MKKKMKNDELQTRRESFKGVPTTLIRNILVVVFFMAIFPINAFSQEVCFYYKGSWSEWKKEYGVKVKAFHNWSGIDLMANGGKQYFGFKITNYVTPSKKEKKMHRKLNMWFEYEGTVYYYVSDAYPTAESLAKACVLIRPNPRADVTPRVKREAKAKIKIAPYRKHPECYNVWFDGIGVGISLYGFDFE